MKKIVTDKKTNKKSNKRTKKLTIDIYNNKGKKNIDYKKDKPPHW